MKIGSHIKPRSGKPRHVSVHGTQYAFAPIKDKRGVTHFVADVSDADHAALLIGNDAFYAFDPAGAEPARLTRGGGADADKRPEAPPAEKPAAWPAPIADEAHALLDAPAQDIAVKVGNVSTLDVVRAALELEAAGKARKNVTALLETTLKGALEAGA